MIKSSSFGSHVRKRLSDITNTHSLHESPLKFREDVLPALDDSSYKNHVHQLLKENAVMMKLIQEKDKIIESNGFELQKLRVNLQITQLQNRHLAQSNTQMLTELNTSKDRLKALQHELACKDTLYKFKMLDLQEKAKIKREENSTLETKSEKAVMNQPKQARDNDENKVSKQKRGRSMRSQSLGPPRSQQAADKEITENKRRCLRRQSVMLKRQETPGDLFEINVNTPFTESLPLHSSITGREDATKSEKAVVPQPKQDSDNNENKVSKTKRARPTRSQSLGPPRSQQAVYKEIDENKRRCLRRQSVTQKPQETPGDLFEINVVNTPFSESLTQPLHSSIVEREDDKEPLSQSSKHSLPQRSSIGRPVRRAAEKIQSYKDPTLKSKMRRP